jgi:hypothetical protein
MIVAASIQRRWVDETVASFSGQLSEDIPAQRVPVRDSSRQVISVSRRERDSGPIPQACRRIPDQVHMGSTSCRDVLSYSPFVALVAMSPKILFSD